MFIDTHSHLNFKDFDNDRADVIKKTLESGVFLINVGSDYESSKKARDIASQYEYGVWAGVGLHPSDNKKEVFDYQRYKELAQSKKVVAIGECGLDFLETTKEEEKSKQKDLLIEQINLATELKLPLILHCRKAHKELIEILQQQSKSHNLQGVVHCFTGSWEEAEQYMELGFYLGFNGIIFKFDVEETIKKMPLEKMLLETDCPFLTPPQILKKRNEPVNVKFVAQKIAEIRSENLEKISETTFENAKKLFNLD